MGPPPNPDVQRSPVLLGVASVLAGTTAIFGVFGVVYNPILFVAALPFGAATYVVWRHATGQLGARVRERATPFEADRDAGTAGRRASPGPGARPGPGRERDPPAEPASPSRLEAARVLEVDPDADDEAIRVAFRERARELHPDAPDGDAEAFQDVIAAYDRLKPDR